MEKDAGRVLEAFRNRFAYDRGLKRLKPVEHYMRLFPGFEDDIAREFARLDAEPSATPPSRDPPVPGPQAPRSPAESTVGPYRLLQEIGRGGQASVHLAEDTRLPRKVALKVFAPGLLPSEQFLARFRREAEAASRLDHPGICTVYEAGVDRDTPYIAMRYVEGRTLAEWIDASRAQAGDGRRTSSLDLPTPPASPGAGNPSVVMRVVALVEKTARALHAAHEAGLVHRDVKPGNIMVTNQGEPVLLDFGLAREDDHGQTLTVTGALLGTPAYMSPEQLLAQRVRLDCRTDVYSLGVTLYECLTLKRPFDAPTREGLYQQILSSEADSPRRLNPQIPQELVVVLETAMAKNRDRRYGTALEFAEDLRRLRVHEPIHARPTPPLVRMGRWAQRNPAMATGVVAAFTLLALGLVSTSYFLQRSRGEQTLTQKALDERTAALREAKQATQRAEAETRRARSLALSNASAAALDADPMCALLLAREAVKVEPLPPAFNRLREAAFHVLPCVVLAGHDADVHSAAFSPKGDLVVTASLDATARVWDSAGTQVCVLKGHATNVCSAAFSPTGDRIVTASQDRTARLWDLDGLQVAEMRGHRENVTLAVFSPDGERIVTCSFDHTARLWDSRGDPVAVLSGHAGRTTHAAFSPDGLRVLTSSDDKTAAIWNLEGRRLAVLTGHTHWVGMAAFSPAGDKVVTASEDGTARVWDLKGTELAVLTGHEGAVLSATFDPRGDRILTSSADHTARIWDLKGRQVALLKGHDWGRMFKASFSPSGDRILTGSEDGTARVWDISGRELLRLTGHSTWITSAVFSPQGDHVVTASRDGTARLWDLNGREWAVLVGHTGEVRTAAWSPDGARVVTASDDATARVWDPDGREIAVLRGHSGRVRTAAYSPAGDRIVTASEDKTARVWDPEGTQLDVLAGHEAPVCSARFSLDGKRIVTASEDGTARLWNPDGKCVAVLKGHAWVVAAATFSPDGERIVTASWDRTARVWDLRGEALAALSGHEELVYTAEFSPKGDRIVTASFDGTARLWNAAGGQLAVLRDHVIWVRAAAFAPAGDVVATASSDRTSRLWSVAQTQEPVVLAGHENWVWGVAFSAASDRVVTASTDRTARIWDRSGAELAVLKGHEGPLYTASVSPRGDRLLTASSDRTARIWLMRNDDVLDLAQRRTTRDFTRAERQRYADLLGPENADVLDGFAAVDRHEREAAGVTDLRNRLRADPSLSESVRAAALAAVADRRDDPVKINEAQWPVVKAPGRTAAEYRLAARRLKVAESLVPLDGNVVNTFGVAQYRAELYTDALATLMRSDAINSKANPPGIVEDVAFLAMCQHRLGLAAAAHDSLVRLRELMKDEKRAAGPDAREILKETEALVGGE